MHARAVAVARAGSGQSARVARESGARAIRARFAEAAVAEVKVAKGVARARIAHGAGRARERARAGAGS